MNGYRQNTARIKPCSDYCQGGLLFLPMEIGFRYGNMGLCVVTLPTYQKEGKDSQNYTVIIRKTSKIYSWRVLALLN